MSMKQERINTIVEYLRGVGGKEQLSVMSYALREHDAFNSVNPHYRHEAVQKACRDAMAEGLITRTRTGYTHIYQVVDP